MTLRELQIFYELSNMAHVGDVAKKLGITQSAVSLAIKSLENKMGEKLYDRIGKNLLLNERGKYFKSLTKKHYNALLECVALFRKDTLLGELNIAASRTIGDYIMPQILFDFKKLYPEVSVKNSTTNSQLIAKMVEEGSVNIGFIESRVKFKNISMQKIGHDELIVVSSDKKLAKKSIYIDRLFEKIWLLREEGSGTREIFLNNIGKYSTNLKKQLVFSSFESIKRVLYTNKDALTCISRICVEDELKKGVLFEVDLKNFDFKRDFYLIYHKNKYKNRLFLEFTNFAVKYFINN